MEEMNKELRKYMEMNMQEDTGDVLSAGDFNIYDIKDKESEFLSPTPCNVLHGENGNIEKLILNGHNILMHGPGGCGKTFAITQLCKMRSLNKKVIKYTALTGAAAINIPRATTLHRWAGIGLGKDPVPALAKKIMGYRESKNKWQNTDILVIDEVSMLGLELFEKLDSIAKIIRRNDKPFGGIQLILSGDFLQLMPVNDRFCFESERFASLNLVTVKFEEMKRYDDPRFFDFLLRARVGALTDKDKDDLGARIVYNSDEIDDIELEDMGLNSGVKPTILHSKRIDVSNFNANELEKLPGAAKTYSAKIFNPSNSTMTTEALEEIIPLKTSLKVGAQVMLRINLNVDEKLINGSRGVVTALNDDNVIVLFPNASPKNLLKKIDYYKWEIYDSDKRIELSQIPLILAWSLTIHKSQGATLDCVECDLGDSIFCDGQAYVALSRVRNFDSLFLKNLNVKRITANKRALAFISSL